jgi:hypothetical protein
MDTFALYLQQFSEIDLSKSHLKLYNATDILADFHLLRYLVINDIFSFSMVTLNLNKIIVLCSIN